MSIPLATVHDHGDTALIAFRSREQLYASDVQSMLGFWRLMEDAKVAEKKVVVFRTPPDFFSPRLVEDYWQRVEQAPVSPKPLYARYHPEIAGVTDATMTRSLGFLRSMPALTLALVEGDVDFDLLGLFLSCDYHVAVRGTRFINRTLKRRVPPGTGTPWFLTRLIGYAATRRLYLDETTLDADEAMDLGFVDQVVDANTAEAECLSLARLFEPRDPLSMKTLTRAIGLTALDLDDYLERSTSGFSA